MLLKIAYALNISELAPNNPFSEDQSAVNADSAKKITETTNTFLFSALSSSSSQFKNTKPPTSA